MKCPYCDRGKVTLHKERLYYKCTDCNGDWGNYQEINMEGLSDDYQKRTREREGFSKNREPQTKGETLCCSK